jgi:hypothetical protein
VSVENFKLDQMVCAVQKNDKLAYAQFKVKAVNMSVTALIRSADKTGIINTYRPGVYALVEFVSLLEGVRLFCHIRINIRCCICTCTRACVGQGMDDDI